MPGLRQHRRRYVAVGLISTGLLFIAPAVAWADAADITIDFIRHGQSIDNAAGIIDTVPPGTGLTPEGITQATTIGEQLALANQGSYAELLSSEELRAIETAGNISAALDNMPVQPPMAGLDEINAGIYEGQSIYSLDGLLYLTTPMAWVFGADLVPMPGSPDVNGVVFDQRYTEAVDAIYDQTANAGANPTDIAVSSEGSITTWALMNVKNPDFSLLLTELLEKGQFLPNVGEVVVHGDPQDGWTLVSYDGVPVPQNPDLPTELFVDFRNLIEAPQFAGYDIYQALLTGNSTTIEAALQTGINQVDTALAQFPVAVLDDVLGALTGATPAAAGALVGDTFAGL
ncbi:phosphoglycerate mutase family protein [Mycobacterium sp.]|uniref:phosphoglycerate mutase family protein n=1 Tax=Mycobacterium sp. TaxID=1785 RepID=UPI003C7907B9